MKFSVNWLREIVDLPDKIENLAELLTLAGVEIERIEERGAKIDKVIIAQITASSQHPNADRLTVCVVDDGSGQTRQVVCGATNYKAGDKVPLALPGAVLPNGLEIKKSKLRGVESEGMLCSGKELGFSEDAAGLLILSPDAKSGAPIVDLFPSDTILDVEITPNRGDLLSHYGLAREISALVGQPLRLPNQTKAGGAPALQKKGVEITAPNECPFYSARQIDNIKVGPSPDWLRAKIEAAGIRSINNIVDISNFVMLELGQPTHAFDANKLKGGIVVRLARVGEKFLALDGKTYSLTSKDLVIADQERVVGIGGVMGGEETGVTDSTKNVLLEAAYFLPAAVRRTARTLNLPSDASYRFERGVDPGMILRASQRATELIREIAGGSPAKELATAGKLPSNPPDVSLSYQKCDQVLGLAIKPKTVDQILERFGLSKASTSKSPARQSRLGDGTTWRIPSYRRDLQRDVDLIEEVVRAHGVDKVSGTDRSRFTPSSPADHSHDLESALRDRLVTHGLCEVRTSKLISRKATAFEAAIVLKNPLSEDHVALRPSLYPALLDVLVHNVRGGAERVAIFEIGRIFPLASGKEERHLGILLWGNTISSPHWKLQGKRVLDFFDLKGAIESLTIPISFRRNQRPDFPLAAEIWTSNQRIGFVVQVPAERTTTVGPTGSVLFAEIHIDLALEEEKAAKRFREIERFPAVTRDIAMIVPEKTSHDEIERVIRSVREPLLKSVELFDLFTGETARESKTDTKGYPWIVPRDHTRFFDSGASGPARKSLAYRLTYRDRSRTLTSEEVTAAHARIRERLQRELRAELRE